MNRIALIMAGGSGTRFWPSSVKAKPKQFLSFDGKFTLLENTIKRLAISIPVNNQYIIGNVNHKDLLTKYSEVENIYFEPMARNTSAAIIAPLLEISKLHEDAIVACLPSDHHIRDDDAFSKVLEDAFRAAEEYQTVITLGIKPNYPATGFGYLKSSQSHEEVKKLDAFVEKPPLEVAKEYLKDGHYYWNAGIFVAPVKHLIKLAKELLPDLYQNAQPLEHWHKLTFEQLHQVYSTLPAISIDYGIMEKCKDIRMIPLDCGWSDLGSWESLDVFEKRDDNDNILKGDVIAINTTNSSVVSSSKSIVTYGIDQLIVIEDNGVIFITTKESSQKIKDVVSFLKDQQRHDLL